MPLRLFHQLYAAYGPQRWWPARGAFEMMAGAVLVQNTAWTGAAKAVANLDAAGRLTPAAVRALDDEALGALIRPAGYFRVKGRRLRALAEFLAGYDDQPERLFQLAAPVLRERLLAVHGVGRETADSIVCYGAAQPVFVVDAYTRRLFHRLGWTPANASYEQLQALVMDHCPRDADLLAEYHALIVRHAKRHCRVRPLCRACPVHHCPHWLAESPS